MDLYGNTQSSKSSVKVRVLVTPPSSPLKVQTISSCAGFVRQIVSFYYVCVCFKRRVCLVFCCCLHTRTSVERWMPFKYHFQSFAKSLPLTYFLCYRVHPCAMSLLFRLFLHPNFENRYISFQQLVFNERFVDLNAITVVTYHVHFTL